MVVHEESKNAFYDIIKTAFPDYIWFHFLARHWPEEVNYWWPRDKADFKVIDEGAHFLLDYLQISSAMA